MLSNGLLYPRIPMVRQRRTAEMDVNEAMARVSMLGQLLESIYERRDGRATLC